ncbi:hypothetical protein T06_3387 [Trichinella sp. T6]|nr:hypothetical protein T06_3387 [Trichinella sp. T6]
MDKRLQIKSSETLKMRWRVLFKSMFLLWRFLSDNEISVSAMRIPFTFGSATIKFSSKQSASIKNMH